MMPLPTISAIVPTHDRPDSLARMFETLVAQQHLPDEVIVVNDGLEEVASPALHILRDAGLTVQIIRRTEASSTASRNAGIAAATGDIVLLLEDDIELPADFVSRLAHLYGLDEEGLVAAIGPAVIEPHTRTRRGRLWQAMIHALGGGRWHPRRSLARETRLPRALRARLEPAVKISAGGLSLRRHVAQAEPFDEAMTGYAYAEDRELSFRLAGQYALYRGNELRLVHRPGTGGRGSWQQRGRGYVANSLHIARQMGGDIGMRTLVGIDFLASACVYLAWAPLSRTRRAKLAFVVGMTAELLDRGRSLARRWLCG